MFVRHSLLVLDLLCFGIALGAERHIAGVASVIDADTIENREQLIRLNGIDAPESDQQCLLADQPYLCGRRAAQALDELIETKTITCVVTGQDRYKRSLATCRVGGTEINDWLVRNGHAVVFGTYSGDYIPAEEEAHAARLGMWAGQFEAPWEWRRRKRGE